ncbi:MAG: helix-turn-helix domain-containing protein [Pseudobdellovibrionaceae bacterium]|nr:helix-turn-helix domain-containing protein [Pseudobdellovibrionaceae bacterium]
MELEKYAARLAEGLGKLLLRYRTENNLTRAALAEKLSISEGRIRQLESGENAQGFRIEFLVSVANVMDLSPPALLSQLIHESNLSKNSKAVSALGDAFEASVNGTAYAAIFKEAIATTDELFGNHFVWSQKMAAVLLRLNAPAKARLEIALRQASPEKGTEEYRARILRLMEYDLDN